MSDGGTVIPLASRRAEGLMPFPVTDRRAPVAAYPSLLTAGAHIPEADAAQAVASDPSVIDAERDPLYGDRVESHDYDDAIHIAASGDLSVTLCGQSNRANVRPFSDVWNDYEVGGQGCWTCLDARAAYEASRQSRLSRWQEQR